MWLWYIVCDTVESLITDTSTRRTPLYNWHLELVPAFLYYLYLALYTTEISLRQTLSGGPKEGLRRQLTVLLVCTWRQGGHVGDQGQKHFSPLGTKLYFQVNSSRKILLFWPPTWPPRHVVKNQEFASFGIPGSPRIDLKKYIKFQLLDKLDKVS